MPVLKLGSPRVRWAYVPLYLGVNMSIFFFMGNTGTIYMTVVLGKLEYFPFPKLVARCGDKARTPCFFHRPVKKFGYPQQHQSYPRGKTSNLWSLGTVASCIRSLRSWTTLILGHFWNENLQAEVEAEALKPEGDNGTDKAWGWVGLEDPDPLTGFPSLGYRQKNTVRWFFRSTLETNITW